MMRRIIRIVVSPRAEWARIGAERAHAALVHAFTLSIIPAAASFVMARNSDLEVPRNALIATYLGSLLTIYTVAAAFWLMVRLDSREAPLTRCMQVAAYGATPVLLASVALFSPVLVLVCVITLPYVFYLYYLGVQELLRVPAHEASQFVAIALVAAFVASSLGGAGIGVLGLL